MTMPEMAPVLDTALRATLLLTVAAATVLGLRHRSAALRARVWILALGGLLALPVLQAAVPALELPSGWRMPALPTASPAPAPAAAPLPGPTPDPAVAPAPAPTPAPAAEPPPRVPRAVPAAVAPFDAPPTSVSPSRAADPTVPALPLLWVWLIGAAVLLGRTVVGHLGAAVRSARARTVAEPRIRVLAHRAATAVGAHHLPRLAWSPDAPVPMTTGVVHNTVLLPLDARDWSDDRLLHVLLHELAHVARRDTLQGIVADAARALHWPNPLAWLAAARFRQERERACDDRVLEAGCRPSDYAGHLLGVAAGLGEDWRPAAGAVPMARPSELPGRIRAILHPGLRRGRLGLGGETATLVAALAVAGAVAAAAPAPADASPPVLPDPSTPLAPRLPGVAAAPESPDPMPHPAAPSLPSALCSSDGDGRRSTSVDSDRRRTRIEWEVGDCRVDIELRGDILFGDDDRSIVSMADGARLEVEEDDGGATRWLRLDGTGVGEFTARYRVDGDDRPFEPEGRRWLADILPDLFRQTTLDAENRVDRLLARGGVDGVLAEIGRMTSDHVIGTYFALLASRESLSVDQTRRVLDIAMERVESDHYRYEILKGVLEVRGLPESLRATYLAATADIESDHYKAEALTGALAAADLDPATLEGVLATAAADIESDHYLAEILAGLVDEAPLSTEARGAFLRALERVESDHYRSAILEAFLDAAPLSTDEVADVLELSRLVESDHYKAELLQRVARDYALDGPARAAFLRSAARMESDHYVGQTALALMNHDEVAPAEVDLVLDLAAGVESDHERAEILVAVVRVGALSEEARPRFLELARAMGSRHYRDLVLATVAR